MTSVIGSTERLEGPGGTSSASSWRGFRNLYPAGASNLLSRQVLSPRTGTADEYTIRVATSPHPCTWRTLLIKVAAEVVVRTRRILVRLSSSWRTWIGIAACASACTIPSQPPFLTPPADPLNSSLQ